jgi:hypothetical protein
MIAAPGVVGLDVVQRYVGQTADQLAGLPHHGLAAG